jgi:hypothetical protein
VTAVDNRRTAALPLSAATNHTLNNGQNMGDP